MKKLVKIALILFAVIAALLVSEIYLRTLYSHITNYDIEMWKYATKLKVPVPDKRRHWHKAGASAVLMGQKITLNSRGWRDSESSIQRDETSKRIMVVGDSLTFGWGVPQDQTFSARLQSRLNPGQTIETEVINLGIGNSNTEQHLAVIDFEAPIVKPSLILLCFYLNDLEKVSSANSVSWWQNFIVPIFLQQIWWKLRPQINPDYHYKNVYTSLYEGESWSKYQLVAKKLASWSTARGIPMGIVLLPDIRSENVNEFGKLYKKVEKLYRDLGFEVVNLHQSFPRESVKTYWVAADDPHPNTRAHQWIASQIYNFLLNRWIKQ